MVYNFKDHTVNIIFYFLLFTLQSILISLSTSPFLCFYTRIEIYLMEKSELFCEEAREALIYIIVIVIKRPNRLQTRHCCFYKFLQQQQGSLNLLFLFYNFLFFLRAERMFVCVNLMNEKKMWAINPIINVQNKNVYMHKKNKCVCVYGC